MQEYAATSLLRYHNTLSLKPPQAIKPLWGLPFLPSFPFYRLAFSNRQPSSKPDTATGLHIPRRCYRSHLIKSKSQCILSRRHTFCQSAERTDRAERTERSHSILSPSTITAPCGHPENYTTGLLDIHLNLCYNEIIKGKHIPQ